MKSIVTKAFIVGVILALSLANSVLSGWHRGYDVGYKTAMADVLLKQDTPENFFTKELKKRRKH